MGTRKSNRKSKKSNKRFRTKRRTYKVQKGKGGIMSVLKKEDSVLKEDEDICILYITTHGHIQNNIINIDEEKYKNLEIKKINAVDMDVCNFIKGNEGIETGKILTDYKNKFMTQDIELEAMTLKNILIEMDPTYNNAINHKLSGLTVNKSVDYDNYKHHLSRAYKIYDIQAGTEYYNKLYFCKMYSDYYPFKESNTNDILLIEKDKTTSLIPKLGYTESFNQEKFDLNEIGNHKIYLNEIIDYLYNILHKTQIIIVDLSCAYVDSSIETNRGIRSLRRRAYKEGIIYGGKNKKKTNT